MGDAICGCCPCLSHPESPQMLTRGYLATSQATTGLGLFCLQAGPLVSLIIVLNGSSEEPGLREAKATSRCGLGEGRPCGLPCCDQGPKQSWGVVPWSQGWSYLIGPIHTGIAPANLHMSNHPTPLPHPPLAGDPGLVLQIPRTAVPESGQCRKSRRGWLSVGSEAPEGCRSQKHRPQVTLFVLQQLFRPLP